MKAADFFRIEQDSTWSTNGDPWSSWHDVLDTGLIERIKRGNLDGVTDLDAAQGISRLAYQELLHYGTNQKECKLDNDEMAEVLSALRAVLRRLGIGFRPPFRDFTGFHGYWSKHDMGYSWAARRGYLSELFGPLWEQLDGLEDAQSASAGYRGVDGQMQNIIFASTGFKPEMVMRDAINNVVEIVEHGDSCLVYDRPLTDAGLTWGEAVAWWRDKQALGQADDRAVGHDLYRRLRASMKDNGQENQAEVLLFNTYCERYQGEAGMKRPVLLPQVYLHYDPLTRKQRQKLHKGDRLKRERMDFLLMWPGRARVVIEVDGKQHYAEGKTASPRLYAEMVAEDRALRLKGYEVYRFGGYELTDNPDAPATLRQFFDDLEACYGTTVSS
jgi:very-short-patch-repair endonuclease